MEYSCTELPPGFRFHPTDEELIVHYLANQAESRPCPVSIIPELNIYKFDPWQLPDKSAPLGEDEWYFFTPRDRKYPNGARPNRATASGYWKATGTDKAIYSDSHTVGVKKTLVFYRGRPPKGAKTDWIMHEYRLLAGRPPGSAPSKLPCSTRSSMRLDDWVLCRIHHKKHHQKSAGETSTGREEGHGHAAAAKTEGECRPSPPEPVVRFPARSCSLAHLLELEDDEYAPLSRMLTSFQCPTASEYGAGDNRHAMAIDFAAGRSPDCDVYGDPAGKFPGGSTNVVVFDPPSFFRY